MEAVDATGCSALHHAGRGAQEFAFDVLELKHGADAGDRSEGVRHRREVDAAVRCGAPPPRENDRTSKTLRKKIKKIVILFLIINF